MPRKRAQSVWSFLLYATLGAIGVSRELCTLGLTALNTPPTKCGRKAMVTPISLRNSSRLWNAKYVHGLEQSKKHSSSAMIGLPVDGLIGHGRAWPGHLEPHDVGSDGRVKPGHDEGVAGHDVRVARP